jgi:hypothetical protein
MTAVWFKEADQRAGRYGFEVLTSPDGMVSKFRRTDMRTDVMAEHTFKGEQSCDAAMRRFTDEVLAEVHGL